MAAIRYSYRCACKRDPMSGSISGSEETRAQALRILDAAWADSHKYKGCTHADQARTVKPWKKQKGAAQ